MTHSDKVIFILKVDHDKVVKEYNKYKAFIEKERESKLLREQNVLLYQALLCSEYIHVPEDQLGRFIKFGAAIKPGEYQ